MLNSVGRILVETLFRLGMSIIPVGANKKALCPWKEYQQVRASESQFEEWIRADPSAFAIVTGEISGVIVLDFDGERGIATMRYLGLDPHVRTGSGGYHVYFVHPGWHVATINSKSKRELGERYPGLDIRGDGGYAIFAGSSSSGQYEQLRPLEPYGLDRLNDEVRNSLGLLVPPYPQSPPGVSEGTASALATTEDWCRKLLDIALSRVESEGRNNAGFWLACQLRDNGLSRDEAERVMSAFLDQVPPTNTKGRREEYSVEEALDSLTQAFSRPPRKASPHLRQGLGDATDQTDLPVIVVSNKDLRLVSQESMTAIRLANHPRPRWYARSNQLVRVEADEKGRYGIREVSQDHLKGILTRVADYRAERTDDNGVRRRRAVYPPTDVVRDILAQPPSYWDLPPLESITGVPIIRPDGSVVTLPGYDSITCVVYTPAMGFRVPEIPDKPTLVDIEAAIKLLNEMYGQFPFVDEASRANMLGLLLTLILRKAINGNVPIALVDAPAAGSGKSLLAETAALIITGTSAVMQPAPGKDEEELRKLLTAVLLPGYQLCILDNAVYRIESPSMARLVTATMYSDRLLGQSKTIELPQTAVWVITGNNIILGGDIPRRSYWIRLDAKEAHPWLRSGFRIPDLKAWVLEKRAALVAALLTIARAWFAAGKPAGKARVLGGFEEWTRTLSGVLDHAGVKGFLDNAQQLYEESDPTETQWQAFLDRIYQNYSGDHFSAVDLVKRLRREEHFHAMLPDDLIDDDRGGNLFQRKVGNAFRQRVDRPYGPYGVRLVKAGVDKSTKTIRWRVEYQKEPPADYWPAPLPPSVPNAPPPTGPPFSVSGL